MRRGANWSILILYRERPHHSAIASWPPAARAAHRAEQPPGRRQETEVAAASAERDPPHAPLAALYLALGDRDKARHHALMGYKRHRADVPSYADHWPLRTCRTVLQALGESEPQLPPFDPAKIAPIEYQADIRRLLAKHTKK